MITIPRAGDPEESSVGSAGRSAPVSFVSDFRYLDLPFEALAPALLETSASWLLGFAGQRGGTTHERAVPPRSAVLRIGSGPLPARIPVLVSLGQVRAHEDEIVVAVTWEPLQLERLLPDLDADLLLSRVDVSSTRLGLTGRYRAPMAWIGHGLDRIAMHGLAESTVRRFLEEADAALRATVPAAGSER